MNTLNGIDLIDKQGLDLLKNKRVGLLSNHTGLTADLRPTLSVLQAKKYSVTTLFSPEHGFQGHLDENVPDGVDPATGLPIYSLYGERKKPSQDQLKNVDVLVYDIQDIGCRFYTYISTMGLAMEACAEAKIPFIVLDRINPINGVDVEGPLADTDRLGFTAYHTIPLRHGMTVGELARMFNAEKKIGCELVVVSCEGWQRTHFLDGCGLYWVNPSPNMRRLQQALLYPGVGLLEGTNLSVGRGTDTPFEVIGAPWIQGRVLADALNALNEPGVRFTPLVFTPTYSTHKEKRCEGVAMFITDRSRLRPVRLGIQLALTLRKLYMRDWQAERMLGLFANRECHQRVMEGAPVNDILALMDRHARGFKTRRKSYLLY